MKGTMILQPVNLQVYQVYQVFSHACAVAKESTRNMLKQIQYMNKVPR